MVAFSGFKRTVFGRGRFSDRSEIDINAAQKENYAPISHNKPP